MAERNHLGKKVKSFAGIQSEWLDWKKKFMAMVESRNHHLSLIGDRPEGEHLGQAQLAAQAAWDEANRQLYLYLVAYCDGEAGSVVDQFRQARHGLNAWNGLLEAYEPHGAHGKAELVRELRSLQMGELENPSMFYIRLEELKRRMDDIGCTILEHEGDIKLIAVTLLPKVYNSVVSELEGRAAEYTYAQLKTQTISHFKREIRQRKTPTETITTSIDTTTPTALNMETICTYCTKHGHQEFECRKKKRDEQTHKRAEQRQTNKNRLQEKW